MNPAITFTIIALVITIVGCVLVEAYDRLAKKHGWDQ